LLVYVLMHPSLMETPNRSSGSESSDTGVPFLASSAQNTIMASSALPSMGSPDPE
jgi:hypothetical protein